MNQPIRSVWRLLKTPISHSPLFSRLMPSCETVKKGFTALMAMVVFYSQAVCAGTTSLPLLSSATNPGAVTKQSNLLERLMKLTGVYRPGDPYVFHDSEYQDRRKLMDPGQDLKTIQKQQERAQAKRDIENVNSKAGGMQFPELNRPGYRTPKEVLAGAKIDQLEKELTPGDLAVQTVNDVVEVIRTKMKSLFGAATEFNFNVKKNFDGTYARTYLVDGRANRIVNSKTRNPHGMAITQNITNMRYSSSHILVSMDIEHTDVKGRTSYTTRRMDYLDGAKAMVEKTQKVKEMWEDTVTSQGETKTLHRWDMRYDAKDNMTHYIERSEDENDRVTEKKWWGAAYDDNKNLLKYQEVTTETIDKATDKKFDTYVTWEATGYEKNPHWSGFDSGEADFWGRQEYQLTGYVKTTVGPNGLEQKDVTTNMTYNGFANLLHYERTLTTEDGRATNVVWDGDYDQYDRAAAYRQVTTDWFGQTRTVEFSDGEYTVDDDLIAYREKTTQGGETIEKRFQDAIYDTKHNLMDYFQTETDSRGRVTAKHWTASGAGLGYKAGDLVGYEESISLGALRVRKKVTDITYDSLHQQNGGLETKRVTGVETDGEFTDVTVVTDTRVKNEVVDRSKQLLDEKLGYEMNVVEIRGFESTKTIDGVDNRTKEVVRDLTETTVRSEMTPAGDFNERKTTKGSWDGEELDSVVTTKRTNVEQDGFGRAMSYVEEVVDNDNAVSWIKRTTDRVSYNLDGNITASHEVTENTLGVRGEVTRSGMRYDQQNRVEQYNLVSTQEAEGAITGSTTRRENIGYNGLGDVSRYKEKQVRLGSTVEENIEWKGQYGVLGLVGQSDQVNRRTGTEVVDGQTRRLDVTETTRTRGMKYIKTGASLRAYREEVESTASPELMQITTQDIASPEMMRSMTDKDRKERVTHDSYGRLAAHWQKVERVTRSAVRADGTIDESKADLHAVTETTRSKVEFDKNGGITGYTDTVTQNDGQGKPAGGSTTVRRNMTYHPLGSLRSYEGTETKLESPDISTEVRWRGMFDRHMRSAGFMEQKTEKVGNLVGVETSTVRDQVTYDDFGQLTGYQDRVERSDAPNAVSVVTWEKGLFDQKGSLESYRETTRQTANGLSVGLNNVKVVERTGTSYDGYGQLDGYRERSMDTAQPDVTVETERKATEYDRMGRERGTESVRHEVGESRDAGPDGGVIVSISDKWTTVLQVGKEYNEVGLVTGFKEASFDGATLEVGGGQKEWGALTGEQKAGLMSGAIKAGELLTVTERSGTVYNGIGMTKEYIETTRDMSTVLDHGRRMERRDSAYNNLRQLTGYEDTNQDESTPGVTETVVASGGHYNGFGQMVKRHEVKSQEGALVSRSEGDRTLTYDSEGRTKRDRSVMVSDNGITVDRDHRVTAFNGLGKSLGEKTETVQSGVEADGRRAYEIATTSEKFALTYDQNGRLKHSEETVHSTDKPDVTVRTVWDGQGYNGHNQLMGFVEKKTETNPAGINEAVTVRSGFGYDQKNRTQVYQEVKTGTADAITETVNWNALGFTPAGQASGTTDVRRRVSASAQAPYDVTTTVVKDGLTYDLSGNTTRYEQRTTSSATPGLVEAVTWTGQYDRFNRVTGFREEEHKTDRSTAGQILNVTTVNERLSTVYDGFNRPVGYVQSQLDVQGNTSQVEWAGVYDGRGLVNGFEEKTTDPRGNRSVKKQDNIRYDAASRSSTYNQKDTTALGLITETVRGQTVYNHAGLVGGTVERVEETQPDGLKTVTNATKTPVSYDVNGHLVSSRETGRVTNFDRDGAMLRNRTRTVEWTNGTYNELGQIKTSDQTTMMEGLGGAFELTSTTRMSGATYDLLGRQKAVSQSDSQSGTSVETLALPSDWSLLEAGQKLDWLKNLTFVVGGESKGFDDLGLSGAALGETRVDWSVLTEADQMALLEGGGD
jgi:hypothetical protein